jgi:hypothetical protein
VRRHGCHDGEAPEREGAPAATLERDEHREVRERAREEEEAVHPPVHGMEEERPAGGHERPGHERDRPARESRDQQRHDRDARDGEGRRDEAQRRQPAAQVRDREGEQKVERRAAALAEDDLEQRPDRAAPDEERERLVLVRRPRVQARGDEGRDREHAPCDPTGERAWPHIDAQTRRQTVGEGPGGRPRRLGARKGAAARCGGFRQASLRRAGQATSEAPLVVPTSGAEASASAASEPTGRHTGSCESRP